MAIFDQSTTLKSPPSAITQAIQASATSTDQCLVLRPDMLLIVLRGNVGCVHLLRPQEDGTTQFRLIADTAAAVREAFRGKQLKEALSTLVSTPANADAAVQQAVRTTAGQQMEAIRQRIEPPSPTVLASPVVPSSPIVPLSPIRPLPIIPLPSMSASTPVSPLPAASADVASIFERKPLPGTDQAVKLPSGSPWNPDQLIWITIFFAPIAGIGMGINWRRLGKPTWMWPTILASIFLPIGIIGLIVVFAVVFRSTQMVPGILIIAGLNWGFIYAVYYLQRGAYKTWDRMGNADELLAHPYNFTGATLIGGGIVIVFALFGLIAFTAKSQPATFESSELTITYSNTWARQDINRLPNCKQPNIECLLVVSNAQFGLASIYLVKVDDVPAGMTAQRAERLSWDYLMGQRPSSKLASRDTTTIAGVQGARRLYYTPNAAGGNEMIYGMQIYFLNDNTLYELTAEGLNDNIFQDHKQDIDQFIAGIKLK